VRLGRDLGREAQRGELRVALEDTRLRTKAARWRPKRARAPAPSEGRGGQRQRLVRPHGAVDLLNRKRRGRAGGGATRLEESFETYPVSTEGGTRRVRLVRKEGRDVSSQYGRGGAGQRAS